MNTSVSLPPAGGGAIKGHINPGSPAKPDERFCWERRHRGVNDACRLRREERYIACVDDVSFDGPNIAKRRKTAQ